jgi:hypothetical protein
VVGKAKSSTSVDLVAITNAGGSDVHTTSISDCNDIFRFLSCSAGVMIMFKFYL